MNLKAENIIKDCEVAISRHTSQLQGVDFRLSWWTIVSLLRAIGHVLDKVDKHTSEKHRSVITYEFNRLKLTKPKPEIFWEFIEAERNKYLKEYEYNVRRQLTNRWINDKGEAASLSVFLDDQDSNRITPVLVTTYQESFIKEGFFKGQSELQVARKAILWWQGYLDNIKVKLNS